MTFSLGHRVLSRLFWNAALPASLLALLLLLPQTGHAARGGPPGALPASFLRGTEIFRRILLDMKLHGLKEVEQLDVDPKKTILIVLGDPARALWGRANRLGDFLAQGGAVLFASDQRVHDEELREELTNLTGCFIAGTILSAVPLINEDIGPFYRSPQCPFLVPPKDDTNPNLFHLAPNVATNRPSYLRLQGPASALPALARLPFCWASEGDWGSDKKQLFTDPPLFAVGGTVRKNGRLLLLADHSLFINMMMMSGDIENVEFTCNCLEYLRGLVGAKRDQVLLLEEGKVNSNFNIPLKQLPGLSEKGLQALLANANRILAASDHWLAEREDEDFFNRKVTGFLGRRGLTEGYLAHVVIVLLTLLLLALGVWRLLRSRGFRSETALPLLAEALQEGQAGGSAFRSARQAGPAAGPSLLEQRQQELLEYGNLWENARQVSREVFLSAGLTEPANPSRPPKIRTEGGFWQRWQRQRQVLRLWRLAFDPRPCRVRPRDWPGLLAELDRLQADLANGSVQVEMAA